MICLSYGYVIYNIYINVLIIIYCKALLLNTHKLLLLSFISLNFYLQLKFELQFGFLFATSLQIQIQELHWNLGVIPNLILKFVQL